MVSVIGLVGRTGALIALGLSFCFGIEAHAAEHVLYAFQGGNDGIAPFGGLILGSDGNFYGTTAGGGGGNCLDTFGCGTIFSLTPQGVETVLYAFQGGNDGAFPEARLVADASGNFYGNTNGGGTNDQGTVFKFTQSGSEVVLYRFTGGADGGAPEGDLAIDGKGNLYGATFFGGNLSDCFGQGCGTVFEISADGDETTLYSFVGGSYGWGPIAGVIRENSGNLYGTTSAGGGSANCTDGCGTVYEIASDGTESVVYAFQSGNDGRVPRGGLLLDGSGNLLGTTGAGGSNDAGTIFKIAPDGTETVLYVFKGGSDGEDPEAGVIMDKSGNLYGTTYFGGGTGCKQTGHIGCGTVFKLAPDGTETVLFAFKSGHKGRIRGDYPAASLLLKNGLLYGTASAGGTNNDGGVFSLSK